MCLSVPAKVIAIEGDMADVSVGGTIFKASLRMVENVEIGSYILLHTGFAIQKINEEEALETLQILKEMKDALNEQS